MRADVEKMSDARNQISARGEPDRTAPANLGESAAGSASPDTGDAFSQLRRDFERGATLRTLTVVVPMYREEKRIERTIATLAGSGLHRHDIGFCFVDDGSPDDTIARTYGAIARFGLRNAEVLRLDRNCGKGGAVRAGILHVAVGSQLVGFLDADLSLDPSEVITGIARLELTGADALVGERIVQTAKQPKIRRLGSLLFRRLASSLVPTGVRDSQCAMKLFRSEVAVPLFVAMETTGFAFDVELMARLKRGRYVVTETPVLWEHQAGSQINAGTDAVRMIREVLAIRRMLRTGS